MKLQQSHLLPDPLFYTTCKGLVALSPLPLLILVVDYNYRKMSCLMLCLQDYDPFPSFILI